ncbi:MAG: glycosyltransferase [Candidatus Liptonbacteria bacterium]|nr:glycosyltransferase [Candidatus Liptonbacteria bacterium]
MAQKRPSLTVVVTAYNEEDTLERSVRAAKDALAGVISDYEIIVIDDASRDRSGAIADELAREDPRIRSVHNEVNLNQGGCYKKSIALAAKEYHCLLPGDDMVTKESLKDLFRSVGKADMSLIYIANEGVRHPVRWVVSEGFVLTLNILFGFGIKYYNGPIVVRTDLLKTISLNGSFAFCAETIIPLLYRKKSYTVVPMIFTKDKKGPNMKAIKRNFFSVVRAILKLFWELRVRGTR